MHVETAWFTTGIKLPNGKNKTAISDLNRSDLPVYEMTAIPQMQVLSIKSRVPPMWEVWVPFMHVKFMHVREVKRRATAKPKEDVKKPKRRASRRTKTTVKPEAPF
jgi:hypothetical protein